jgi:hypothetical protein
MLEYVGEHPVIKFNGFDSCNHVNLFFSFPFYFILFLGIILLQWRREVAFAGFDVPIQMDVSAEKMIYGVAGIAPERRAELIKV